MLVHKDLQVTGDHQALLASLEMQDHKVIKVQLVQQVIQEHQAIPEVQDCKVIREPQVTRDLPGLQELQELLVNKVLLEPLEPLVRRDLKDLVELQDLKDHKDRKVVQELLVPMAIRVTLDHRVHRGLLVSQDPLDLVVIGAQRVLRGHLA